MFDWKTFFHPIFWWLLIKFVAIVCGSALSKLIFLLQTYMFYGRSTDFSPWQGIHFAVEIYSFSHTASTAVSETIMSSLFFYSETGKCSQNTYQNTAEILRNKNKPLSALWNQHGACFRTEEEKQIVFNTACWFNELPSKQSFQSWVRCSLMFKELHTTYFHGLKTLIQGFLRYPVCNSRNGSWNLSKLRRLQASQTGYYIQHTNE